MRVGPGAALAPGSSIGTLNFADEVTLTDGAIIEWEFRDTTAYDRFTLYDGPVFGFARERFEIKNESDWAHPAGYRVPGRILP